jgi:hypothetical protein
MTSDRAAAASARAFRMARIASACAARPATVCGRAASLWAGAGRDASGIAGVRGRCADPTSTSGVRSLGVPGALIAERTHRFPGGWLSPARRSGLLREGGTSSVRPVDRGLPRTLTRCTDAVRVASGSDRFRVGTEAVEHRDLVASARPTRLQGWRRARRDPRASGTKRDAATGRLRPADPTSAGCATARDRVVVRSRTAFEPRVDMGISNWSPSTAATRFPMDAHVLTRPRTRPRQTLDHRSRRTRT